MLTSDITISIASDNCRSFAYDLGYYHYNDYYYVETQPPIQWVPGALSLGVKRPGREADQSPHLVPRLRMLGATLPFPQYIFMVWCLVKHRDNFNFTLFHKEFTYGGVSKSFWTESIRVYMLTFGISRLESTQRVMAVNLTRLTHKMAIQLNLVAEGCTICSLGSGWQVRKLLDTLSYITKTLLFARVFIAEGY
jgi:hypothetical protein